MVSNEEIMDMLKVILEKVERLEGLKADKIEIESGSFAIRTNNSPITIHEANDVLIQPSQQSSISFEQAETITVNASAQGQTNIECKGSIEEGLSVNASYADKPTITTQCSGEIHGDVKSNSSETEL